MAKQYFVMGIGGTGMRCIESLIHLCAMGMFDDTEIHLLALDTDKNNGNFSRLKEVKEAYVNSKNLDKANRTALTNTFFSADIKYYEFSPNYEKKSTFKDVFNYGNTEAKSKEETDLADLVLTDNVENFNLRHGYRAQTHLGSMMMYHSIIEAARSRMDNDLKQFLQVLIAACNGGSDPKVFILGSVFGGTGASSIPIIPQAISEAAIIMSNGAANVLGRAYFASTLLTAYFSFKAPSAEELKEQKVIATSDKFALNSQVAMMFYDDDTTVKNTYQRFYMMGTDGQGWDPMVREKDKITKTITGGSGKFEFKDFVGNQDNYDKDFAKKFGMLIAFSFLCNDPDIDFVESVRCNKQKEITGFDGIDVNQVEYLKKYFRLFNVRNVNGELAEGWIRQIHRSANGGDNFLFNPKLFAFHTMKELRKYDWNKSLYRNEGVGKDWTFSVGIFGSKFDTFKKKFIEELHNGAPTTITNTGERFYKLIYETLCKIYNIN